MKCFMGDRMIAEITVPYQYIGYHKWSEAPAAQAYLKNMHRHVFKVNFTIEVKHDDREIEFFDLQEKLTNVCQVFFERKYDIGSCETQAKGIIRAMQGKNLYPDRKMKCEVSEDGECSATVYSKDD